MIKVRVTKEGARRSWRHKKGDILDATEPIESIVLGKVYKVCEFVFDDSGKVLYENAWLNLGVPRFEEVKDGDMQTEPSSRANISENRSDS